MNFGLWSLVGAPFGGRFAAQEIDSATVSTCHVSQKSSDLLQKASQYADGPTFCYVPSYYGFLFLGKGGALLKYSE